jgi:hypothetical protein
VESSNSHVSLLQRKTLRPGSNYSEVPEASEAVLCSIKLLEKWGNLGGGGLGNPQELT